MALSRINTSAKAQQTPNETTLRLNRSGADYFLGSLPNFSALNMPDFFPPINIY